MKTRARISYGDSHRLVFEREFDLKTAKFHLASRVIVRVLVGALPLLLASAAAFHFEQVVIVWFSLIFAFGVVGWQLLAFGFTGEASISELSATRFYSKSTLIFLAVFWALLIVGVAIALYLKFPDS